jgi:hypothetical protein
VQHEFFAKQQHSRILEQQKAVPFVDTRAPEWYRERKAHHELNQRRLRDGTNDADEPVDQRTDLVRRTVGRRSSSWNSAIDCHKRSGLDHPRDIGGKIECRTRLKRRRSGLTKRLARNQTRQKDRSAGRKVSDNNLESGPGYQRVFGRDRLDRTHRNLASVDREDRDSRKFGADDSDRGAWNEAMRLTVTLLR